MFSYFDYAPSYTVWQSIRYNVTMQSLFDVLGTKDFDVPPEVSEIKTYVKRHFDSDVQVAIQTNTITLTVRSAALAGSLRPHLYKLAKQLNTDKKLVIRIG